MSSSRKSPIFVTRFLDDSGKFGVEILFNSGTAGAPDWLTFKTKRYWKEPHPDREDGTTQLVPGLWQKLTPLAKRADAFILKHNHDPSSAFQTVAKERELKEAA